MLRGNFSFLLGWKSSVELKQPFKLPALQHRVNYAENDRARNPSGSIQAEAFKAKSSLRQQSGLFFFSFRPCWREAVQLQGLLQGLRDQEGGQKASQGRPLSTEEAEEGGSHSESVSLLFLFQKNLISG